MSGKERWKPVVGYEDCYSISDRGRLARTAGYGAAQTPCWKIRAAAFKNGYLSYHLCKDGIRKYRLAHVMVWEAFKGPIPKGREINHKNGNRRDPWLRNLELMTRSQNAAHSFSVLGRANFNRPQRGSKNGSAKLTEADIPKIFALAADGLYQWQIAEKFGVSQRAIGSVLLGTTWRHVSAAKRVNVQD
jgi:hypothetical protein